MLLKHVSIARGGIQCRAFYTVIAIAHLQMVSQTNVLRIHGTTLIVSVMWILKQAGNQTSRKTAKPQGKFASSLFQIHQLRDNQGHQLLILELILIVLSKSMPPNILPGSHLLTQPTVQECSIQATSLVSQSPLKKAKLNISQYIMELKQVYLLSRLYSQLLFREP